MRIDKFESGYKLTDLYIAAAILCEPEMELMNVEPIPIMVGGKPDPIRKQNIFVVKGDTSKMKIIIDNFFNGKHMVDANLFKSKVQVLKSRMHAQY